MGWQKLDAPVHQYIEEHHADGGVVVHKVAGLYELRHIIRTCEGVWLAEFGLTRGTNAMWRVCREEISQ